jgi:hypothetical protein
MSAYRPFSSQASLFSQTGTLHPNTAMASGSHSSLTHSPKIRPGDEKHRQMPNNPFIHIIMQSSRIIKLNHFIGLTHRFEPRFEERVNVKILIEFGY